MSLQNRQELIDNAIHNLYQIMQCWEQRFSASRPQFGDRFFSAQQNIILHFRTSKYPTELWAAEFIHKAFTEPFVMAEHDSLDSGEQLMFIDIVKLVQPKKGFVPTLVRLQRVDQFYSMRTDKLYYSLPGLFVTGQILANRESDVPLFFDRDTGTMDFRKLVSQMVQCSAQIDYHVPGSGKSQKTNMINKELPWWALSGCHVHVDARNITVLSKEPLHITEILFGPLNLCPH
jgi:hypothetical protein